MVARASTRVWVGMVVSLAVTPLLVDWSGSIGRAQQSMSRAHSVLNTAIDCYRRGDYALADSFFQQAQTMQEDLTAAEKEELASNLRQNNQALQARRDGAEQLRRAEEALRAGRTQEANLLLREVVGNQFLTTADNQRRKQLMEQVSPGATLRTAPANRYAAGDSLPRARAKLQQARALMAKNNYEAAEALAREADALNAPYSPTEDTPKKVIEDIDHIRTSRMDAKQLLAAARSSLERGDLDRADRLVAESEKASSFWSVHLWGDSPSKVHRDIQSARVRLAQEKAKQNALAQSRPAENPGTMAASNNNSEAARQLIRQGRAALQVKDYAKARKMAMQAKDMKPDLKWWDDTPEKLLMDVQRMDPSAPARATASVSIDAKTEVKISDPKQLVKQGREYYTAGKLDEAKDMALRANAAGQVHWGLFEDSPDKLLADVQKAKLKRDQEESVRLLSEARRTFDKSNGEPKLLDEAQSKAYKAERLHGPYSIMDFGDRPHKLIAEIETARAKSRKTTLPPPPPEIMARTEASKSPMQGTPAAPPNVGIRPPMDPRGGTPPAVTMNNPPPPSWPPPPSPPMQAEVRTEYRQPTPIVSTGSRGQPPIPTLASPTRDLAKERALQLVREARRLQREGHLVESRQQAIEAQKLGAVYAPTEDRPDMVLVELAALCKKRIESLIQEATDYAATAQADQARFQKAEGDLALARQLAVGFGVDTQPIDSKMAWVRQTSAATLGTAPRNTYPTLPDVPAGIAVVQQQDGSPQQRGRMLLDKARQELRAGQTDIARRIAVEVYTGNYGVQPEADQMLKSIDMEEFNQQLLAANRGFEEGLDAFQRQEFSRAYAVWRAIDVQKLEPQKLGRLRELMQTREMLALVQGSQPARQPEEIATGRQQQPIGVAHASDRTPAQPPAETSYAEQVKAMQEVEFQKRRQDGLRTQQLATERFQAGDIDRALDILQAYKNKLDDCPLDPDKVALLRRPIDARLQQLKMLQAQQSLVSADKKHKEVVMSGQEREFLVEKNKQDQVASMMKQYDSFFRAGKYREAETYASRAHDLDPDNPVTTAAQTVAHTMARQVQADGSKKSREAQFVNQLNAAENEGPEITDENPLHIDSERTAISRKREADFIKGFSTRPKTDKERDIERKLSSPVSVDFKDTPLSQALNDLHEWSSINIVPDTAALQDEGIALDRPVTLKLEAVSLKSALNILLHQVRLTYVIADEALQVTTQKSATGKQERRTFHVADLVTPVGDYLVPASANIYRVFDQANQPNLQMGGGASPFLGRRSMTEGTPVSSPGGGIPGGSLVTASSPTPGNAVGQQQTIQDLLMTLIKNTIAPSSWTDVGGAGTIDYFPLGMGLIINQTPDVLDQVADLLDSLRKLQDLEVAVEVRMISLEEAFFERIGLDFDINIRTNNSTFQPQLVAQQFAEPGFLNTFTPNRFVSGLTPAGTFTNDLNIPIRSNSFNLAIPPFGGFPNAPGADGGLSLGLAFLSDIQVFMFMEAAQGDRRTNMMQAPKLTLFNGQTSTITVNDFQFFVTNVIVGQAGGQIFFVPTNVPVPIGPLNLTIQAVVSADRRFVRMNLAPLMTSLTSATVPLFPITTFITPVFDGGAQGQPVPFTQFIQQPGIATVSVNTTVAVPDGGTVLLGGLKILNEGRNEFGPPILSKIPYINRLFKNVGYGRDTQSLMLMVTPRIIINSEEEERALGGTTSGGVLGGGLGGGGAGGAGVPGGPAPGAAAMGPGAP